MLNKEHKGNLFWIMLLATSQETKLENDRIFVPEENSYNIVHAACSHQVNEGDCNTYS